MYAYGELPLMGSILELSMAHIGGYVRNEEHIIACFPRQ